MNIVHFCEGIETFCYFTTVSLIIVFIQRYWFIMDTHLQYR